MCDCKEVKGKDDELLRQLINEREDMMGLIDETNREIIVDNTYLDEIELDWDSFVEGMDKGAWYVGMYTAMRSVGMQDDMILQCIQLEMNKFLLDAQGKADLEIVKHQEHKQIQGQL